MGTNKQAKPVVHEDTVFYQEDGQVYRLLVDTPAWYTWLNGAQAFAFRSEIGTFTAYRERAGHKRGGWYWRAYRKHAGQLHRAYLGMTEEVTLDRLKTIAARLSVPKSCTGEEYNAQQSTRNLQPSPCSPATSIGSQISGRKPFAGVRRTASPLPLPLTSLVGREQEIAAVSALLLQSDVRLLNLTGTGGVGKTRLGLSIANKVQEHFSAGVCFVSLAPIQDPDLVLTAIVQTLGLPEGRTRQPLELLRSALCDQQMLLVLDNFEHVIAAASNIMDMMIACPQLTLLVTSRETLRVRGEYVFVVHPLALPASQHLFDLEQLIQYDAVALFLERARPALPASRPSLEEALLVVDICRRLDGLPLAIELAATRLNALSLPALLEGLEHRLPLLTKGQRDLPARQHTLRDTIAWSYDLLSASEQCLFRLLSVFVGGATLEAIEQVYQAFGGQSDQVLDGVSSLLDKHLLQRDERDTTSPRFLMLETLREYGWEALAANGEMEVMRQAHAKHYLTLAEEASVHLFISEQQQWFGRLEQEHDNLRAALQWSLEQEQDAPRRNIAWRLAGALQWFWIHQGYVHEGQQFVEHVLEGGEGVAAAVRAKVLHGAGWLALWQREYTQAEALCQESLGLYQQLRDQRGMALVLHRLGRIASSRGDALTAIAFFQESLSLSRKEGDAIQQGLTLVALALTILRFAEHSQYMSIHSLLEEALEISRKEGNEAGIAWALYGLGQWHFQQGEASAARPLFEESLGIFRSLGQRHYIAHLLFSLAKAAAEQQDISAAYTCTWESVTLFQELDDQRSIAACLEGWARVVARQREYTWAAQLWGTADVFRKGYDTSDHFSLFTMPGEEADHDHMRTTVRAQLGEHLFTQALAEGRMKTPAQALSSRKHTLLTSRLPTLFRTSVEKDGLQENTASLLTPLTRREEEVLRLVAQGFTDAHIAECLVISPRTVNAHLRSIYSKLHISSRHSATLYAIKHQLV